MKDYLHAIFVVKVGVPSILEGITLIQYTKESLNAIGVIFLSEVKKSFNSTEFLNTKNRYLVLTVVNLSQTINSIRIILYQDTQESLNARFVTFHFKKRKSFRVTESAHIRKRQIVVNVVKVSLILRN